MEITDDKNKLEELASKYVRDEYIDYGDLNYQAEEQIKKAFIDGGKAVMDLINKHFKE